MLLLLLIPGGVRAEPYALLSSPGGGPPSSICPAGHTCYYVSSSGGNDSNNGTSQTTPWQTTSKVESKLSTFTAGDEVLFKRGDTWTGDNSTNVSIVFGDTASHAIAGSPGNPIVFGAYGTGAQPLFDGAGYNPYGFAAVNPSNAVHDVTIDNFEFKHVFVAPIYFVSSGATQLGSGITFSNNTVHNTGPSCYTTNGACKSPKSSPPAWTSGTGYALNAVLQPTSSAGVICPDGSGAGNAKCYIYRQTNPSGCTSGTSVPTWNQTVASTTTGDGTCSWYNTGANDGQGHYANQINGEDDAGGAHAYHIIGNYVHDVDGWNCYEIHHDTGAFLVSGNTGGPGCEHGIFDVKGSGTVATPGMEINNIGIGGALEGYQTTTTFYTENAFNNGATVYWEQNIAYDVTFAFQSCPGDAAPSGNWASNNYYYNNTIYLPAGISGATGFNDNCGQTGSRGVSTIDIRNNIIDGGAGSSININKGYATATENYNNIGGAQGSAGFFFAALPQGAKDQSTANGNACNPSYVNASTHDFRLLSGSCDVGAGLGSLVSGNNNIGYYNGTGQ